MITIFAPSEWLAELGGTLRALRSVAMFSVITTAVFLILIQLKLVLLPRGREMRSSCTWDCGFSRPDSRMEYTGSAFTQPLVLFYSKILGVKQKTNLPTGDFPESADFREESSDPALEVFWKNIFRFFSFLAGKLHFLQSGYLHLYILIMTAALILMLIWGLVLPWNETIFKGGL